MGIYRFCEPRRVGLAPHSVEWPAAMFIFSAQTEPTLPGKCTPCGIRYPTANQVTVPHSGRDFGDAEEGFLEWGFTVFVVCVYGLYDSLEFVAAVVGGLEPDEFNAEVYEVLAGDFSDVLDLSFDADGFFVGHGGKLHAEELAVAKLLCELGVEADLESSGGEIDEFAFPAFFGGFLFGIVDVAAVPEDDAYVEGVGYGSAREGSAGHLVHSGGHGEEDFSGVLACARGVEALDDGLEDVLVGFGLEADSDGLFRLETDDGVVSGLIELDLYGFGADREELDVGHVPPAS